MGINRTHLYINKVYKSNPRPKVFFDQVEENGGQGKEGMEKGKEEREEEKGRAQEKERRKEGMKKAILRPGRRKKGKAGKIRERAGNPLRFP